MEKDRNAKRDVRRDVILPVMEEELQIGKRKVETGVTRVVKKVGTSERTITEPLEKETVEVERVAVNRIIDRPVAERKEGDVTIIPVMEEVLVVEKKLCLKEELRIMRRHDVVMHTQREVVQKEEAVVEHDDLREEKPH